MRWTHGLIFSGGAVLTLPTVSAQSGCTKLCSYDSDRTGSCQMNRAYMAQLIEEVSPDSVWTTIAAKSSSCEATSSGSCDSTAGCQTNARGDCSASRRWVAGKLASPEYENGANLGMQKCGLLGQLMASDASCSEQETEEACESNSGTGMENICAWDLARNACGVPPATALALLRRDYQDELVRVSLRRQRCTEFQSNVSCKGSCRWLANATAPFGGTCSFNSLEALLAVIDQDCPLRLVLGLHSSCSWDDSTACESQIRADGLPDCLWINSACEANPAALEMDLLDSLGLLTPDLSDKLTSGFSQCADLSQAQCTQDCAPS
mmetsp:Transcript_19744/g.35088  ORF Transcript_19744/g.35088 Transcript_19744/m.35088 type:complete len:322 (-) Transcript_19744:51-1016(-)